jgi:predicted CXXCH cytochrome family protein
MKKAIVALAIAAFASSAFATVANSAHDLTANGLNSGTYGTGAQISACQFCHAPHNVNTGIANTPLWNRNTPTVSYTMYTSATLSGIRDSQPNANSMTCLSCHDGATDMGATYTGLRGFTGQVLMSNVRGNVVGTNLGDDHPISIRYTQAAGKYAAVNAVTTAGLRLYGLSGQEKVECGSCHDPHNTAIAKFLRVTPTTICTTCHLY